jgi:hypothetical protein
VKVFNSIANPQAGGPTLAGCPQLLIPYIHINPFLWETGNTQRILMGKPLRKPRIYEDNINIYFREIGRKG